MTTIENTEFEGVYRIVSDGESRLATRELKSEGGTPDEPITKIDGVRYRPWSPYDSKLSAAILSGLGKLDLREGSRVLYLGAASGTTASYISDIVGDDGAIFCVEFAPRPMRDLLRTSKRRENMVPILSDAREPASYSHLLSEVDLLYQDVAQPEQSRIFCANAKGFLGPGGSGILMIKSRSIDVSRKPREIYEKEISSLRKCGMDIEETVELDPYVKDHIAVVARMKDE